jgi:hypothetical protein
MATEYAGEAYASSGNPQDWGRAVVAALSDLVSEFGDVDGLELGDGLVDKDIALRFTRDGDGVIVRVTWTSSD